MSFEELFAPKTCRGHPKIPEGTRVRDIIRSVQELLEIRPVASAQFLRNNTEVECENDFHKALPYCGYVCRDGPWKGALIRHGIDPRSDPKYRMLQTIYLPINCDPIIFGSEGTHNLLVGFPGHRGPRKDCHLFDGQGITAGVQSWQLCDLVDDQLARIVATEKLRAFPCKETGFFFSGTWAKLWEIMGDKIICLRDNCPLLLDDYERLLSFPDEYRHCGKSDFIRYGVPFGEADTRKTAFLRHVILKRAVSSR
ncbi:RNA polymerase III transcription factor IIIC subunit-domain-containing protein [Aspergillus crustosus]